MKRISSDTVNAESRASHLARLSRFFHHHRNWIGYVFILPWLISFLWFDLIPFLLNIYFSFTDFSIGFKIPNWLGLSNYKEIFTDDPLFITSLKNTIFYVGFSVPLIIILAFSLALLLNTEVHGKAIFRTIFYIPAIVPVVATATIWLVMFRTQNGLINELLSLVHIEPIRWLTQPEWAKPALILMSLWSFGWQMVIFLAGLQGIPQELYEAAEVDGSTGWKKLIYITVPLMTPVIFFNLVLGIIDSFQVFTSTFIMTNGGPLNATLFYMLYLYNNAFGYYRMGYASAMALILFLIILGFSLIVNWTSNKWVFYGD